VNWSVIVGTSLVWSGVFVALFGLVLLGGVLAAPDAMVQDYPPAIRERYGPKSPRGERVGKVMALLLLAAIAGTTTGGILALRDGLGGSVGFWPGFVFGAILIAALHVFDLLVVDWLLFCTIRPRWLVLPGTEGMPEYRDWLFHVKVLFPRPVPWPLLMVPAYGALVGLATALSS
jgi:hypothetical protein